MPRSYVHVVGVRSTGETDSVGNKVVQVIVENQGERIAKDIRLWAYAYLSPMMHEAIPFVTPGSRAEIPARIALPARGAPLRRLTTYLSYSDEVVPSYTEEVCLDVDSGLKPCPD